MSTSTEEAAELFVRVKGARVRVSVRGQGRPLLLITGLGANVELWDALRQHLEGFRTIAFDPPGIGRSTLPFPPPRMRGLAEIAAGILDELGVEQSDVLGVSWGGALAQELALTRPERVRRLVLASTSYGVGGVPGDPVGLLWLMNPLRHRMHSFPSLAARLYGGAMRKHPELVESYTRARRQNPPTVAGYLAQLAAISGWMSLHRLHRITQPTLVMTGDDDPIVPVLNGRVLAARIPGGKLHIVRGGGHLFLLDQPRAAAATISEFLDADS